MKWFALLGLVLFLGLAVAPSITAFDEKAIEMGNVIIVDDEGDGDYTSIREAVNHSNAGDTIEVYSGTYNEYNIWLSKQHINMVGVAYEYMGGNDSGRPLINGSGKGNVFWINVSNVTVSNFRIENPWSGNTYVYPIRICDKVVTYQENIIISNNDISNSSQSGIYIGQLKNNIQIINNSIRNCRQGIGIVWSENVFISNNKIIDCSSYAIWGRSSNLNIKNNIIVNCEHGIYLSGVLNNIHNNHIENVGRGVYFDSTTDIQRNFVTQNNFINTTGKQWFNSLIVLQNKWDNNYWDNWKGLGSKIIPGSKTVLIIPIPFLGAIIIDVPWFQFDKNPAQESYDI